MKRAFTIPHITMAAKRESNQLTQKQIIRLAAAVSTDDMAAIAEGYMDIADALIKNLQYDNRDDAQGFNRGIIRHWANKHRENQVQVIFIRTCLGKFIMISKLI